MKFVKVEFKFEIPVMLRDDEDDVDAYYTARDKFPIYNVNDAQIKVLPSSDKEYKDLVKEAPTADKK